MKRPLKAASLGSAPGTGDMEPDIIRGTMNNDMNEVREALARDPNSVNTQDSERKFTPLHIAAALGNLSMVNFLLEQQCLEWGIKDIAGRDPLETAILTGHPGVITTITRYRARILGLAPANEAKILPFKPS